METVSSSASILISAHQTRNFTRAAQSTQFPHQTNHHHRTAPHGLTTQPSPSATYNPNSQNHKSPSITHNNSTRINPYLQLIINSQIRAPQLEIIKPSRVPKPPPPSPQLLSSLPKPHVVVP
ncbi:hypothetical protein M0R45_015793 [Rubus argutus]|uniref:Uncharacterized protein n=1 Tax=Rubus argutus TaxID=59490 RepID=A0AAW1XR89_RUBAR